MVSGLLAADFFPMILYLFHEPLVIANLVGRRQRFLADVVLQDNTRALAHCPNTGSMKTCLEPGAQIALSKSANPSRKTPFTWEMIHTGGLWVGINTNMANLLTKAALQKNLIPGLANFCNLQSEVKYGDSRLDFMAEYGTGKCYIEVKNVTYCEGNTAMFPDAQTLRGQKHLEALRAIRKSGNRSAIVFIVQRTDAHVFAPAVDVDPVYATLLNDALAEGVEAYAMQIEPKPHGLYFSRMLPFAKHGNHQTLNPIT